MSVNVQAPSGAVRSWFSIHRSCSRSVRLVFCSGAACAAAAGSRMPPTTSSVFESATSTRTFGSPASSPLAAAAPGQSTV